MKSPFFYSALSAMLLYGAAASAQSSFMTKEYVDVNNIKSAVLVHGDLNWDPLKQVNDCEFPIGTGLSISSATTLWMGGYDQQSQLRTSAQTYRQIGNDFWPGPLENGSLDMPTSTKWAKIWKVNYSDINNHLANTTHTVNNTPKVILEWPAKGNPYAKGVSGTSLTINTDMAPFVDVDQDGVYDPLKGDYPEMKGDQMLWWVFSDNGPTHNNSQSQPFNVEVHAKAYGYKRGTLIDNVVYYEMDIINRSAMDYSAFRMGINADMDLGYFRDDYIGFDSTRRLGYVYNGTPVDGNGQVPSFGSAPPIAGYTFLQMPGDNNNSKMPTGSFMTFNNDNSASGNPHTAIEFDRYLRSQFRDGQPLMNDYSGYGKISSGRGLGPVSRYIYNGNPSDTTQWSECSSLNPPGDRRFVMACNDITLTAGSSSVITFALVATDTGRHNTCPDIDIIQIKTVTDTAWKNFNNPPKSFVSVNDIVGGRSLGIYPSPATDEVHISAPFSLDVKQGSLQVYDMMGRKMDVTYSTGAGNIDMNVQNLPQGVYNVVYLNEGVRQSGRFVKQ